MVCVNGKGLPGMVKVCLGLQTAVSPCIQHHRVLRRSMVKVYWEGGAWVEPVTTSKLLALPHFYIQEIPLVCRVELFI